MDNKYWIKVRGEENVYIPFDGLHAIIIGMDVIGECPGVCVGEYLEGDGGARIELYSEWVNDFAVFERPLFVRGVLVENMWWE